MVQLFYRGQAPYYNFPSVVITSNHLASSLPDSLGYNIIYITNCTLMLFDFLCCCFFIVIFLATLNFICQALSQANRQDYKSVNFLRWVSKHYPKVQLPHTLSSRSGL